MPMGKWQHVAGGLIRPEQLIDDFGVRSAPARSALRAFYDAFLAADEPHARSSLSTWQTACTTATGREVQRPSPAVDKLAAGYGIPADGLRPAVVLFALDTYYALLVKLVFAQLTAAVQGRPGPAERLVEADSTDRLRREMERFEAGREVALLEGADFPQGDPFCWYTTAWSEPVAQSIRDIAARLDRYDPVSLRRRLSAGDVLGTLHQELFPKSLRHRLGEYYTPRWLAEHLLDEAEYTGDPDTRLLDPACGSGTFLIAAIRRIRARCANRPESDRSEQRELCRRILGGVVGYDLNPLAVITARANYLLAIADWMPVDEPVEIPVHLRDSILHDVRPARQFDLVVGNPPWIAWDHLPAEYRRATRPLWERYGLFSLSGTAARHGGGKKDLSMLMTYTAADRYLKDGGRLAFVITQTLLQTKGAGDGFRRFRLGPHGPWLKVLRVGDMVDLQPFPGAANWTGVILLEKGSPTVYPVPYVRWRLDGQFDGQFDGQLPEDGGKRQQQFTHRRYSAGPIDPRRPSSPWFLLPDGLTADGARLIGPSDYQAHLGANSGGANGVYWVEVLGKQNDGVLVRNLAQKSKRNVELLQQTVEPELLYPLLRWADVARYHAAPGVHILLVQDVHTRCGIDETTMRRRYPKTYAYLERFRRVLIGRAAYKRYQHRSPFYSMYNVGTYTVAPIKVVWRRMDRRINAAVIQPLGDPLLGTRPVIAQETCVLLSADSSDEAHYLCAVLNSSVANFVVTSHSVRGGKGFGTPSMLDFLKLRRFDPLDPRHATLSTLSRQAHRLAASGESIAQVQHRIDRAAAELWGLSKSELAAIDRELEENER